MTQKLVKYQKNVVFICIFSLQILATHQWICFDFLQQHLDTDILTRMASNLGTKISWDKK